EIARVGPAEVIVEAYYSSQGAASRKRRWLAAVMIDKPVTRVGNNGNPQASIDATIAITHATFGDSQPPSSPDEDEDDIAPLARLLTGIAGHVTPYDARYFSEEDARHRLLSHFEVTSLEGFGCAPLPLAIRAAGAVLAYLQETQKGLLRQLTSPATSSTTDFMTLDPYTRPNLE